MGEQVAAGINGGVAQLGEHLPCKQGVMSSNLTISICREVSAKQTESWRLSWLYYLGVEEMDSEGRSP